jgi:hypothetical protein
VDRGELKIVVRLELDIGGFLLKKEKEEEREGRRGLYAYPCD